MLGHDFSKKQKFIGSDAPKDLIVPVICTLIELYNGISKKVVYQR